LSIFWIKLCFTYLSLIYFHFRYFERPIKPELPISVQSSSKDIINFKSEKNSANRSSSIFAEALVPIKAGRWPTFTAGSSMASDMPDIKDKLQNPLDNVRVAK
jgi:hypothetical protein